MEKFISEIKLTGDSEFSQRFNIVSDAFAKWQGHPVNDKEEKDRLFEDWCHLKLCLEQGYPM